ncbi:hypothetical protein PAESOLCIP111_04841 [Paenibacillus solanacearum]|uniref:Uncharacterized protein n=1 Tax=Paenibacillus solanacearum TaxID=2048548 RepID=A0A916NKW7_9BACL|nr:hypothetical protein [Paenibacillus solanacearum]CAG7644902.1 hypothetical protein PAESOLCIP111_04841 [Paenibacillus solanacearum]
MINDLAAHFSSKAVRYVRRIENPKEFAKIKKAKKEINAIFSEVGEDFLIEENKLLKVSRKRIMQIQEDEDEDEESKKDGKPICNFFIIPQYRLRVFDDEQQRFKEAGLSIRVYARINWHTYKYIELDLLNETLAGIKWINPNYLDYDYYLYRGSQYPYLLRSIWLSTRLLSEDDDKVLFDDRIGWIDEFFGRTESGYFHYMKDGQIAMWKSEDDPKKTIDQMTYRAVVFLKSIKGLIDKSSLLPMSDSSRLQEGIIGWQDDSKWAIKFDIVKTHTTEEIKRSGNSFKVDSKLYAHLHKLGILEVEGEAKPRPDKKLSNGKRAFVLDKIRLEEFISEHEIYL